MKVFQNEQNRTKQKWLIWWSFTFTDIFSSFFVPRNPQKVFIWIVNLFFSLSTLLSPSLLPHSLHASISHLPLFLPPSLSFPLTGSNSCSSCSDWKFIRIPAPTPTETNFLTSSGSFLTSTPHRLGSIL